MKAPTALPRLLVLTDRSQLVGRRSLVAAVTECAQAGLSMLVLRELDLPEPQRADLAADLSVHVRVVSARRSLPSSVGVHLSSRQPVEDAGGRFHGRSCHDEDEVAGATAAEAGYVTISPVAQSRSKPGYGPALGISGVRRAVAAAEGVPVFALGGVGPCSAASLRDAGAYGVAVMGAVMRAPDPATVVCRLLEQLG